MDFEMLPARTPVTLDEIRIRVGHALDRHPLCRNVQFDIVKTPRRFGGGNWTISLRASCLTGQATHCSHSERPRLRQSN